jgi:hypothetical protein
MKKRTRINFDKHIHTVDIFKNNEWQEIQVDRFARPNSHTHSMTFTNINWVMIVTWDWWRWSFCRNFYPQKWGTVSDWYWFEKLINSSTQSVSHFSTEKVEKEINFLINEWLEEYYEWEDLQKAKERYKELLRYTENETEYIYEAHYGYNRPDFIEHEEIPNWHEIDFWLEVIFDWFEEICKRLK